MTYEVEMARLDGPLGSEDDALVVRMPRARFLELVEDSHAPAPVRERLMEVARTIQRFPLNAWMQPIRGCGCVVGEFLVSEGVDRRGMLAEGFVSNEAIIRFLRQTDHAGVAVWVRSFGLSLDGLIRREIEEGMSGPRIDAVLIEDDEREGEQA